MKTKQDEEGIFSAEIMPHIDDSVGASDDSSLNDEEFPEFLRITHR